MTEFEPIYSKIKNHLDLSDKETAFFVSHFANKKVKKRQFIVQPDYIAKHRNYVVKGAFRSYVIGNDGQEHTINLAIDDWWITDSNSFIYQKPATMFVVALEDSVLLQLDFENEQKLKLHSHKFETFFRTAAERGLTFLQRRITSSHTLTAEQRYEEFVNEYPQFLQRIPQYVLASYLGMTTEYLSKIRNNKLKS
jgi:CRP-like cAMP-binding protein